MASSTLEKDVAQILLAPDVGRLPESLLERIKHGNGDIVSVIGRPGNGGRSPQMPAGTNTEATAELLEEMGPPNTLRRGITLLNWWEVDPAGDGAIVARLSSRDVNKGETVRAQILGARAMCRSLGLRPRFVLEATNQSGKSSIENRLDLQFLISAVRRNELAWVSFREVDRLARSNAVGSSFMEFLEEFEIDLYLTDMGRKMDWEVDSFLLTALGGVAEHERRLIKKRTGTALKRRWLEEGRGWPSSQKFGFRRNEAKFLEVDPEQWPFVERIHFEYSRVGETGQGSLTRLKDLMTELKCPLSRESLRRILTDSIYVTGEWEVTHQGTVYPCKKIEIKNPIPVSQMEANKALLENTKGSYRRTPFGAFMLNTVDVFHARCLANDDGENSPRLRARNYFDRRESRPHTYLHSEHVPKQCRGYSVPADLLERVVVDVLLDMAGSETLQREYLAAASTEIAGTFPTEDVPALKQRIATLTRNRKKILRDFTDSIIKEGTGGTKKTSDLLEAIDAEIDACTTRIELAVAPADISFRDPEIDLRTAMEKVLTIRRDASDEERRRRVLLVGALVSKIVVHDEDDGTYVEVFGHLVPQGQKVISEDLTRHFQASLARSLKPSSKRSLLRRLETTSGTSLMTEQVVWKSPPIRMVSLAFEEGSPESVRRAMRKAHAAARPGRFFARDNSGGTPWEEAIKKYPNLPGKRLILGVCERYGFPIDVLVRSAIGDREALRTGRAVPEGVDEIRQAITWAMEDGFTIDAGWVRRWDRFARNRPFLWSLDTMKRVSLNAGARFPVLAYDVYAENGNPLPCELSGRLRTPKPSEPDLEKELRSACWSTREIGQLGGPKNALLGKLRESGKVLAFKMDGGRDLLHPKWQFDHALKPWPAISSLVELVRNFSVNLEDLQREMSREVTYYGTKQPVWKVFSVGPQSQEWVVAHLDSRFKHLRSLRRRTESD